MVSMFEALKAVHPEEVDQLKDLVGDIETYEQKGEQIAAENATKNQKARLFNKAGIKIIGGRF